MIIFCFHYEPTVRKGTTGTPQQIICRTQGSTVNEPTPTSVELALNPLYPPPRLPHRHLQLHPLLPDR